MAQITIKQIFDEISSEPGTNKKMEILGQYKDNELLKRVLILASSGRIKFYIKQIPDYVKDSFELNMPLEQALNTLVDVLPTRKVTGHAAVAVLQSVLNSVSKDDAYVIERIIEKDCKLGMGVTNFNKVFGEDFIKETPYMGAQSFSPEKAKKVFTMGYAYSQVKMDGRYANAIISDGVVEMESRAGEATIILGSKCFEELAKFDNCVLNGELTMDLPTTYSDGTVKTGTEIRYESNGMISSMVTIGKKTLEGKNIDKELKDFKKEYKMEYKDGLDLVRYTIWDMITLEEYNAAKSNVKYNQRLKNVETILSKTKPTRVYLIESILVKTYEEALAHFAEVQELGKEGTILKSEFGTWKDDKPNWQIKMKLEMTVDMRIIGFKYGTPGKKYEKLVKSLIVESSDGIVKTDPSGMNEKIMKDITANQDKYLGTIVEVKSCGLSKDSKGQYALLHPRVKKFRDDKNTCDSFKSIQEIEAMMKGLKS